MSKKNLTFSYLSDAIDWNKSSNILFNFIHDNCWMLLPYGAVCSLKMRKLWKGLLGWRGSPKNGLFQYKRLLSLEYCTSISLLLNNELMLRSLLCSNCFRIGLIFGAKYVNVLLKYAAVGWVSALNQFWTVWFTFDNFYLNKLCFNLLDSVLIWVIFLKKI